MRIRSVQSSTFVLEATRLALKALSHQKVLRAITLVMCGGEKEAVKSAKEYGESWLQFDVTSSDDPYEPSPNEDFESAICRWFYINVHFHNGRKAYMKWQLHKVDGKWVAGIGETNDILDSYGRPFEIHVELQGNNLVVTEVIRLSGEMVGGRHNELTAIFLSKENFLPEIMKTLTTGAPNRLQHKS